VRIFFSGEIDADVADEYREVRKAIESNLNSVLGDQSYSSVLDSIAIVPILLGPRFSGSQKERRLLQRSKKSADYRLIIDYDAWRTGSRDERDRLLIRNLLEAVDDINRKFKGAFDGTRLRSDILKAVGQIPEQPSR
jgi:Immunity protein 44